MNSTKLQKEGRRYVKVGEASVSCKFKLVTLVWSGHLVVISAFS